MTLRFMRAPVGAPIASHTEVTNARHVGLSAASSAVTDVAFLPSSPPAASRTPGDRP